LGSQFLISTVIEEGLPAFYDFKVIVIELDGVLPNHYAPRYVFIVKIDRLQELYLAVDAPYLYALHFPNIRTAHELQKFQRRLNFKLSAVGKFTTR
jgi:hypothetical protein